MHYDFIAIPDADVPQAVEPVFQHVVTTYASEANKTVSVWRAVPDDLLDFKPHEKTNPIRTILVHQLLSERRFFAQFVGTEEPPVEELLPAGEKPTVAAYIEKYVWLVKTTAAAVCEGHHRLVAGKPALLRRLAAGTDLGLLAAGAAHLPSSDPGADLAATGRARAGPGDLRAFRRREVGRGRPDLLAGGGEEGRVIPRPARQSSRGIPRRIALTPADSCIYNDRVSPGAAAIMDKPTTTASTPSPRRASPCACAC